MRFARRLAVLLLALIVPLSASCGSGGSGVLAAPTLRVATRNLYYGADLDAAILAVNAGDPQAIVGAVTQVRADLEATAFATRAEALAEELSGSRPDLVGLQEAALWRTQSPSDTFSAAPTPASVVVADFVGLLVAALAARGVPYDVVAVSEGFDVELPFLDENQELADLRLTDREVILARADLAQHGIVLANPVAGHFSVNLVLDSGFEALRGWASVDVSGPFGGVRFVTTHLEAEVPQVRDAQAAELVGGPLAVPGDVVLVGDMNDDALSAVPGGTYELLLASGLADAWLVAAGAAPGQTCCFDALLVDAAAPLTERLDLVLVRGSLSVESAAILGADPLARVGGLWASDHAGLDVTLRR